MKPIIIIISLVSICLAFGEEPLNSAATERQFNNNIKLYDLAMEGKDYKKAREVLKSCSILAVGHEDRLKILKAKEQIFIKTSEKVLEEISSMEDSVDKAWKYNLLARNFNGMPVAKKALEEYAKLRRDNRFRNELIKREKEQWAERQLTYAISAKNDEKYWIAFQAFKRIVTNFPQAPESVKAAHEMTEMQKDDKAMKEIKKKENEVITETMFNLAQTYESYNKIDEAIEVYNKIITSYPNTVYASRAEKKIEVLKKVGKNKSD